MGTVGDWWRWFWYGNEPGEVARAEVSSVATAIEEAIAARQAGLTVQDALRLPAVQRGVNLICSTAAQFLPLAYRAGAPLAEQPRIVRRPDPFRSRQEFLWQTVYSMVVEGEAFWLIGDRDSEGQAKTAIVLPASEITVEWDERRFLPRYTWRNRPLQRDEAIKHVVNRRPGELRGKSPLREGLPYLAAIKAAEDYATGFFASGGLPEVVLKAAGAMTKDEAVALKAQWVESRSGGPDPAVLAGGIDAMFPAIDPQRAQMQEARAYGATIVARLLGIPAALLMVETSGATITYTNPAGAVEELVKSTISPTYLAPIEAAWSDLVPGTQSVRFDLNDLQRTDLASRITTYKTAIEAGVMTAEEARAFEGWGPTSEAGHAFDPVPAPTETSMEVPRV